MTSDTSGTLLDQIRGVGLSGNRGASSFATFGGPENPTYKV